jgi:hypothetical protein
MYGVNLIHQVQEMPQWRVLAVRIIHLWVRQKKENFLSNCATISFLGKSLFHGVRYEKL